MITFCQILYLHFKVHYNYLAMWVFSLLLLILFFSVVMRFNSERIPLMNPSNETH